MDVWEYLYMYIISMDYGGKIHNQLNFGDIVSGKQVPIVGVIRICCHRSQVTLAT